MKLLWLLSLFLAFAGVNSMKVVHHKPDSEPHKDVLAAGHSFADHNQETAPGNAPVGTEAAGTPAATNAQAAADAGAHVSVGEGKAGDALVAPVVASVLSKGEKGNPEAKANAANASSQAAASPTLEALVTSGSICEKQQIISAYLEKQFKEGPIKGNFNPLKENSVYLAMCKSLLRNPPKVCKGNHITAQPLCPNVNMTKIIDKYLAYGVCTVEAALNQLYHSENKGSFIFDEINAIIGLFRGVSFVNTEFLELYSKSESVIKGARNLFYKAEKALVSSEVQGVFYKRWALLDTLLCGVATGTDNEIMSSIAVKLDQFHTQANVDIEEYLALGTEVFLRAYKPLEDMVGMLGGGLLLEAIDLDKDDFERNVSELLPVLEKMHIPGIKDDIVNELRQMPYGDFKSSDIDSIVAKLKGQVSLVQNEGTAIPGSGISAAGSPKVPSAADVHALHQGLSKMPQKGDSDSKDAKDTPLQIFRKTLVNLDMFVYQGDHILPKLNVERVKAMIRDALMDVSDEAMVTKLIVRQQAAMRIFYHVIKLLVPLPDPSMAKGGNLKNRITSELDSIAQQVEKQFNSAKEKLASSVFTTNKVPSPVGTTASEHTSGDSAVQPPSPSMLQLSQTPNSRTGTSTAVGKTEWDSNVKKSAEFVLNSRTGYVNLDSKINDYVELQKFQQEQRNLLNIDHFIAPGITGFVIALMAFYVIH